MVEEAVKVKVKVTMVEADGPELAEVEGGVEGRVNGEVKVERGVEVEGGAEFEGGVEVEVEGGAEVEGGVEDNRWIKVVLVVTVTFSTAGKATQELM